jgi:hypothetical protein
MILSKLPPLALVAEARISIFNLTLILFDDTEAFALTTCLSPVLLTLTTVLKMLRSDLTETRLIQVNQLVYSQNAYSNKTISN